MITLRGMRLFIALVTTASYLLFPFVDLLAQRQDQVLSDPRFEVASVRVSPPAERGGTTQERDWGETSGRVAVRHVPLSYLLSRVYELKPRQLSGPDWLDTTFVDILAKVPAGAAKEQISRMFQSLLVERFQLRFHWQDARLDVYEMNVGEKGVSFEKAETEGDTKASFYVDPGGTGGRFTSKGGFGPVTATIHEGGWAHIEFGHITMDQFASYLSQGQKLDLPVMNKTGLSGYYRIALDVPAAGSIRQGEGLEASLPTPTIESSLTKLGLRLRRQRTNGATFVVDQISRTPTPN